MGQYPSTARIALPLSTTAAATNPNTTNPINLAPTPNNPPTFSTTTANPNSLHPLNPTSWSSGSGSSSNKTPPRERARAALEAILPPLHEMRWESNGLRRVDVGWGVWEGAGDRGQFVDVLLTVLTANPSLPLPLLSPAGSAGGKDAHEFKLLYSRLPTTTATTPPQAQETLILATLVVLDADGVIKTQLSPPLATGGAATRREAFVKFRQDVEVRLGEVLRGVGVKGEWDGVEGVVWEGLPRYRDVGDGVVGASVRGSGEGAVGGFAAAPGEREV
ncbi:hypothetical protein MBLNU230_g4804t1 [Neophaeotheca triangularis]